MIEALMTKHKPAIENTNIYAQAHAALALIDDLDSVLSEETEALSHADRPRILGLQDRKTTIARLYFDMMIVLRDRAEDMKRLDPAMKDRLRFAYDKINDTFSRNIKAIETAQRAAERIQRLIIEAARASVADGPAYSAAASTAPAANQPIHFQLNERV
jgi:hypothetical protein